MRIEKTQKQIFVGTLVLVFLVVSVFFFTQGASAQSSGTVITGAKKITQTLSGIGGTVATVYVVVWLVRMLASALLTHGALFLDYAFIWNTEDIFGNQVTSGPITLFWGYSRDIANSFLILILLWVAFGIIFNLERFNAKKLLVRVILVGLVINFSLTFTSTVFSFANVLAKPFADQLKKTGSGKNGGISEKIIELTNLHTVLNSAGQSAQAIKTIGEIEKIQQERNGPAQFDPLVEESTDENITENIIPQQNKNEEVVSLPGTNEAEAALPAIAIPAGIAVFKLIGGAVAIEVASEFFQKFALGKMDEGPIDVWTNQGVAMALNPFVGAIFLLVGTFIVISLAIVFVARGIVIMMLAILSPLAFLAAVVPGQDKYWKMWLGKLVNWSFFAPLSFFLLLFAFRLGDVMNELNVDQIRAAELQAYPPKVFQLVIIMGLLIGALAIAKYMGIQLASTLMNFGEKYAKKGMVLATGAGMAALRKSTLPTLGQIGSGLEQGIGNIKNPYLRRALSLPGAGLRRVASAGRGVELESQKKWSGLQSDEIQRAISQGLVFGSDLSGAILELRKRQDLAPMDNVQGYGAPQLREAIDRLKAINADYLDLLKANPMITTADDIKNKEDIIKAKKTAKDKLNIELTDEQAAKLHIAGKIRPDGWTKVDFSLFDDTERVRTEDGKEKTKGDLAKEFYFAVARGEHNSQLGRSSPGTVAKFKKYLGDNPGRANEIIGNMDPETYRYYATNIARELGWKLPEKHEKPVAVLESEARTLEQQTEKLQKEVTKLITTGSSERARKKQQILAEKMAERQVILDELGLRTSGTGDSV